MPSTESVHAFTPEWARHAIWYQVFPERFRNGELSNDPQPCRPWISDWFTPSAWEEQESNDFYRYVFSRRYGGDIQGVLHKLPYLKELGVNAIYLNPIFQSPSLHKYDTSNFLHVDESFGVPGDYESIIATEDLNDPSTWKWTASDRVFLDFLKAAHDQGFKVIIDGAFNHVGLQHPAFRDLLANGRHSTCADWFDVTSWDPLDWNGWAGHKDLPVFRKSPQGIASPTAVQHLMNVTRRWMDPDGDGDPSDGIDGWRLDVPSEIAMPFWVEWRQLVRSINPQAYITGEIWHRADAWLDGRTFDAVMNYEFARAATDWITARKHKNTASQMEARLATLRAAYPAEVTAVLQNLLDSHDTARFASIALNPDREYERGHRAQDHPGYNHAKPGPAEFARLRLAALLQMTYVGAPMIYYGDEAGMWGADDPTNRKPMLWKELQPYDKPAENFVMEEHLAYYRSIIAMRNRLKALRSDNFETVQVNDAADTWVFHRWQGDQHVLVMLNASEYPRDALITLRAGWPSEWKIEHGDLRGMQLMHGAVSMRAPAFGGVVISA